MSFTCSVSDTGIVIRKPGPGVVQHEAAIPLNRTTAQHRHIEQARIPGRERSCSSTSAIFISSGRLTMMPSAPRSLCSQTSATLCEKFGSASEGNRDQELMVSQPSAMALVRPARQPRSKRKRDLLPPLRATYSACGHSTAEPGEPACDELPFVGGTQHVVARGDSGGTPRTASPASGCPSRLIQFGMPLERRTSARTSPRSRRAPPDQRVADRCAGVPLREIQRADLLDPRFQASR